MQTKNLTSTDSNDNPTQHPELATFQQALEEAKTLYPDLADFINILFVKVKEETNTLVDFKLKKKGIVLVINPMLALRSNLAEILAYKIRCSPCYRQWTLVNRTIGRALYETPALSLYYRELNIKLKDTKKAYVDTSIDTNDVLTLTVSTSSAEDSNLSNILIPDLIKTLTAIR